MLTLWDEPGTVARMEREWAWRSACDHRARLGAIMADLDVPRRSVLDVGCGLGMIHDQLVPACCPEDAYTGVDWSESMLHRARERAPAARFVHADLHALPWPDASVDLVVCCEVLGHVPALMPALTELRRVARHALFFTLWITTVPREQTTVYQLPDVWDALGREADRTWTLPGEVVAFEVRR